MLSIREQRRSRNKVEEHKSRAGKAKGYEIFLHVFVRDWISFDIKAILPTAEGA
jgi:hypothetical protein